MKKSCGLLTAIVFVLGCCAVFTGSVLAGEHFIAKFPHKLPTKHPRAIYIQKFADKVAELTHGGVTIKVYPGGQLYKTKQGLEAMALGDVQIMDPPNGHLVAYSKAFELLEIPFLMKNEKEYRKMLKSPIAEKILKTLAKRGLLGLGYWDEGTFVVLSKKAPLNKAANFKGLKIRTSGHPLVEVALHAYGASTVKMAFSEVYTAAQQGVIDGIYVTLASLPAAKFYEVAPYVTVFPARGAYVGVVNKQWYDKLPAAYQKAIRDAFRSVGRDFEKYESKNSEKFIKEIESKGAKFHQLTTAEITALSKIAEQKCIDKARKDVGPLADEFVNDVKNMNK